MHSLSRLWAGFSGHRLHTAQVVLSLLAGVNVGLAQVSPTPPSNDFLTNATVVTATQFELTADLAQATAESFEPWRLEAALHTAWWRWVAPASGIWVWEVPTNANSATLTVFRSDPFQQLTPVAATYWTPRSPGSFGAGHPRPSGTFQAGAGLEYFFQVDVALPGPLAFFRPLDWTTPYLISVRFAPTKVSAPTNDAYAARVALWGTNVSFGGSLLAATAEPNEPRLPGDAMQRTLWWRWTAPGPGTAIIRNSAAVVGIFRRSSWNQLELCVHSGTEYGNECVRYWGGRPELRWDTAMGTTYDIMVDRYPEMNAQVDAVLNLSWLAAPPNDDFAAPQWLNGADLSLIVSNTSATFSTGDHRFAGPTNSKSVWFAWQAPAKGILQVTTNEPARFTDPDFVPLPGTYGCSSTMVLDPCTGPLADLHPLPPFIPVWGLYEANYYGDSFLDAAEITLWHNVDAGDEYRIGLDGLAGSAGETVLNLLFTPPPTNDLFAQRILLPPSAVHVIGRTFAATGDAGQPPQPNQYGGRSVWWEWRAPATGTWALRILRGGSWDNLFAVYRGTNATAANEVAHSFNDPVVFAATGGETFQIGVFAKPGWGSNVEFSLFEAASPKLTLRKVILPYDRHWGLFASDTSALRYQIESSSNLLDWTSVTTNQATIPQEVLRLNDGLPGQFFRTRLVP